MKKLIVNNIGPIKYADVDLNKVNVFMGPQSSGKSTIAKLISFCQWAEKKMMMEGYEASFEDLLSFHRLNAGYFYTSDSFFKYQTDYFTMEFSFMIKDGEGKQKWVDNSSTITHNEGLFPSLKLNKIVYIPAERNFVTAVPDLARYKGNSDNVMSFIYDWYEAKTSEKYSILNLDVSYFNEAESDIDNLQVKTTEGTIDIPLSSASSGLQTMVPLLLILNYNTNTIYQKPRLLSVVENRRLQWLEKELEKKNVPYDSEELKANRTNYHYTQYVIEEPEQNLFPTTQRDLLYHIVEQIKLREKDSVTLTTHSPYILYALNNCLLGHLVENNMPQEEAAMLPSHKAWINPALVSAWEIEDGKLRSVQDRDGIVSENCFDQKLTELTDEYYEMLNYYEDEE